MPTNGSEISYIEIGVADASKSRTFLQAMFGWEFNAHGQGANGWFQTPTVKAGLHGDDPSQGFSVFFAVPDIEAAIGKVKDLGGTAEPPSDEPGFGKFCMCRDPQGLAFGLHEK